MIFSQLKDIGGNPAPYALVAVMLTGLAIIPAAEAELGARRPDRVEKTRPDLDRVAPGPEVHHDLPHRLASLYLVKK